MSLKSEAASFLSQKRIAVVGVSRSGGTGSGILTALRKRGYTTIPVNPQATEIDGEPCYHTLQEIPGGVDAAVVVTRPEAVDAVVDDCIAAGVGHVWMHENAFFGAGASSVSDAAATKGRAAGLNVIAGGCPLMFGEGADFGHRCMRWLLERTGKLP